MDIELLHVAVLIVTAGFIIMADHDGYMYLRGKTPVLSAPRVQFLHRVVWLGLVLMIVTGILLVSERTGKLDDVEFYVKMLMVSALVANGFWIGKLSRIATSVPFNALTGSQKARFLVSGAISASCWIGATCISIFLL